MLEIRNVTKIYHSKSGNAVKALDNVSVTFPETGMVFILGKSGSGKSTLLNVIGGLDGCDSGEFIIKGKSSAKFAGSDFDAYRNTFIGFIFQEYNVLDDFTVGANIGLALELQGKKATSEKITDILRQVDMLDYAKRKPNELSGGQKQRVAIARALVKDPEIIMADEPTGALDSNTGKQIFDTLKELSRTKLVIVVSHDRDFAERYADRIIEMKDGQILSDVTKHEVQAEALSGGILKMTDSLLRIEKGYQLTAKDVELINDYLRNQDAEILVSGDRRLNENVRSAAGISQNNSTSVFHDTDEEKDVEKKSYEAGKTKFIRSRLPMKNAIKMGSSSLGHKKFRLFTTILLSLIAFSLFGFADTLGAYNKMVAATDSILDSHVQNASFSLGLKHTWTYADGDSYSYYSNTAMNEEDIAALSQKTGIEFTPVFNGSPEGYGANISLYDHMINTEDIEHGTAFTGNLYGFASVDESKLNSLGFRITGSMPKNAEEIAISELMYRQLKLTGFSNDEYEETVKAGQLTTSVGSDANSIIGKHVTLRVNDVRYTFKITAVIDTNFDYDRYASYVPGEDGEQAPEAEGDNALVDMVMRNELDNTLQYGFHSLGYITSDAMDSMAERMKLFNSYSYIGTAMNWSAGIYMDVLNGDEEWKNSLLYLNRVGQSSDLSAVGKITWFDEAHQTLGEKEMLVHSSLINSFSMNANIKEKATAVLKSLYGSVWLEEYNSSSISEIVRQCAIDEYISDEKLYNSIREELKHALLENFGEEVDDGERLKQFWRECMGWYQHLLPKASKTEEEVYGDACKEVLEALFEKEFDDSLPSAFFEQILGNYFWGNEDELMFSDYTARDIAILEYAFSEVYDNAELYNSQRFFDIVMEHHYKDKDSWDEIPEEYKAEAAANAYAEYIRNYTYGQPNELGGKTAEEFSDVASKLYTQLTGDSIEKYLDQMYLAIRTWDADGEKEKKYSDYRIVGLFDGGSQDLVISDTLYALHETYLLETGYSKETVAPHTPGIYAFAIAPMPSDRASIAKLVEINYEEGGDIQFSLENQVMNSLSTFNDFIEVGAKVFLYIGIGFAVFSALMLMNFISVSISYKRREIGILRAVGARSSDVFKIFFSEAFIIALINYVCSLAVTIAATTIFNNVVRGYGLNVTLLSFGVRQILLMLVISIAVAAIASFLPVWNIARRKPIDAIKNK